MGSLRPRGRLLGRELELAGLEERFAGLRRGHPFAVLLRGDPGSGKSALLNAALDQAPQAQFATAVAKQSAMGVPFGVLAQLLAPFRSMIGLLDGAMRGYLMAALDGAGRTTVGQVVDAASALLGIVARRQPLIIAIDDVQWCDEPSGDVLAAMLGRLEGDPIGLMATVRMDSPCPGGAPGIDVVDVGPLDLEAAVAIAERFGVLNSVAVEVASRCGGNPLAIETATRLLTPEQRVGTEPLPVPIAVGTALADAFAIRAAAVEEPAALALVVIALADAVPDEAIRRALAAIGCDDLALEPARRNGLLEADGYRFVHPLMRSAMVEASSLERVRRAHRAIAGALERGEHPELWADHLAQGADGPSEDVADALATAGRHAQARGAMVIGARFLERSAIVTAEPSMRSTRFRDAGFVLVLFSDVVPGGRLLREALVSAPDAEAANTIAVALAHVDWLAGDVRRAVDELAAVADDFVAAPNAALFAAACTSHLGILMGNTAVVRDGGVAALRIATVLDAGVAGGANFFGLLAGSVAAVLRAETHDLSFVAPVTEFAESLRGDDWLELSPTHGDPTVMVTYTASMAMACEDWNSARHLLSIVNLRNQRLGWHGIVADSAVAYVELLWREGQWAEAFVVATNALATYRRTTHDGRAMWLTATLARLHGCMGREHDAHELAREARELAVERGNFTIRAWADYSSGLVALAAQRWAEAYGYFAEVRRWADDGAFFHPGFLWWEADYIETLVRVGRHDEARERLSGLLARCERLNLPVAGAMAQRSAAMLCEPSEAPGRLSEAVATLRESDARFELARTLLALAGATATEADRSSIAYEAVAIFKELGAPVWAKRAQQLTGADSDTISLAVLSDQELRVALTVRRGLTNRMAAKELFLSPKTIEFHLGNVYRKLDVRSRGELIARLANLDLD
ncbi:MAG: AAA family ATPase [Acidimicrobiia bacterium]